eukprot:CAMPEP_0172844462 /NCGR_PEP_ID=MMETSP1075-20121228/32245_1 /TAXON_ID=2916 /ORGANISM="Ceratium fusus, Strain PA161109" /LENGTH=74 /DNA_ID=CAMNT_0013688905 /DNA_START=1 /DNA_END=225 /DNA_ORIENTATION=+
MNFLYRRPVGRVDAQGTVQKVCAVAFHPRAALGMKRSLSSGMPAQGARAARVKYIRRPKENTSELRAGGKLRIR